LPRFGGAFFCVSELLLWAVVMPLPHLVPLERLPQPEFDFRAQRAHLPPRFCGQHLSQIILEADREAPILVRVVSHQNPLVGWRHVGAWPAYAPQTRQPKIGIWLKLTGLPI
jgi:hypothetical protein